MNLLNSRGAGFELRNLRSWIERGIRQLIHRQFFAPVIGNEDRVGSNRPHDQHRKHSIATPRDNPHTLAVVDLQLHRGFRMNLDIRFRTLLDQKTDASRLIAGKILIDDASTGQDQRKLFIRNFLRRIVFNRMKLRFAVRMIKAIFKQTRRTRMIFGGTRPEDAVVLFDLLPGDAVVIGVAAARSDAQFVEDFAWRIEIENTFHDPCGARSPG